jgi:hypothetical protein
MIEEIITDYLALHMKTFIALFTVGISSLMSRSLSQACIICSILNFILYLIYTTADPFFYIAFVSFLIGLVLKQIGL